MIGLLFSARLSVLVGGFLTSFDVLILFSEEDVVLTTSFLVGDVELEADCTEATCEGLETKTMGTVLSIKSSFGFQYLNALNISR